MGANGAGMNEYDHDVLPVGPYVCLVAYLLTCIIIGSYFGAALPFL